MLEFVKARARRLSFYPTVRTKYRLLRSAGDVHPLQKIKADKAYPLERLGTEYGGWTFVDDPKLFGGTIVSAGLGEDASFDVEFAKKYNATVIVVDPTPRAVAHFNEIVGRFGSKASRDYVPGGRQPVSAYDLRSLDFTNFKLVPKALWDSATTLKFFAPDNPDHVSHSVVNFQHDYAQDTRHIEVESITLTELLEQSGIGSAELRLIKLDIEGAEIEVISNLLDNRIRPQQILVEFDELNAPSPKAFDRVDYVNGKLTNDGYRCIWTDGRANFLYVLPGLIA